MTPEFAYDVSLVSAALIAIILVPAMVTVYERVLISRRLDDLRTNLWNPAAIRLYIEIFTTEDADQYTDKAQMDALVRDTFLQIHGWRRYIFPVTLLTALISIVVITCTIWIDSKLHSHTGTIASIPEPLIMALIGAYVWSVYEVLSRIRSRDLTPDDLVDMSLRQIAAIPIGYAFSQFAVGKVESAFAFAAAAFPLRDIRLLFRQRMLKKMDQTLSIEEGGTAAGSLGRTVAGLSTETIARLDELHISTFMDLAYIDPVRLMARTGFSLRHVIAWIDQALLAVYALPIKDRLVGLGLPCALDVCEFYEDHCVDRKAGKERDWKNDPSVAEVAKATGIPIEFVPEIMHRVCEDPHIRFLEALWYSPELTSELQLNQPPLLTLDREPQ